MTMEICSENHKLQEWKGYPIFRDRGEYLDNRILNCCSVAKRCYVRSITKIEDTWRSLKRWKYTYLYTRRGGDVERTFSCRPIVKLRCVVVNCWIGARFSEDVRDVTY